MWLDGESDEKRRARESHHFCISEWSTIHWITLVSFYNEGMSKIETLPEFTSLRIVWPLSRENRLLLTHSGGGVSEIVHEPPQALNGFGAPPKMISFGIVKEGQSAFTTDL